MRRQFAEHSDGTNIFNTDKRFWRRLGALRLHCAVAKPSRFSVRRFGRSYFCWKQLDVAAKLLAAECMVIWLTVVAAFSQPA